MLAMICPAFLFPLFIFRVRTCSNSHHPHGEPLLEVHILDAPRRH